MKKIACILMVVFMTITSSVNAFAKKVNFTGQVDGNVNAVTIMVTKSGADLYNLNPSDIAWINQSKVSADGSFSIKIPLIEGDYETHSNAGRYDVTEIPKKAIYLSANGNDSNDGLTSGNPKKTFASVYTMLDEVSEIVILSDMTLSLPSSNYEGDLVIKGSTGSEKLSMASLSLKGNMKLDNLVFNGTNTGDVSCYIFANGYTLEMGDKLTSTGRLTVYGGKSGADCESTDLKLYGGQYRGIYAGGYNGSVTGDTNLVVGGNVNPGDGIDDSNKNTLSPTYVYGGSYGASVGGKTNVTISGNAVLNTVLGAGNGGNVTETNINIAGGKVMNVYGGSISGDLTNCNTNITMTAGTVEGVFGGSLDNSISGNTYVTISGGEVTRRIYGGCNLDAKSGKYVTGTTVVDIYPGASLCTGTGLSILNSLDKGIYAGSRNNSNSAEKNYLIFREDCYSENSGNIKKAATYTLDLEDGGAVLLDKLAGTINVVPLMGRGVLVNRTRTLGGVVTLSTGLNTVDFPGITQVNAEMQENSVSGDISVDMDTKYVLLAAIYDEDNQLIGTKVIEYTQQDTEIELDIDGIFTEGNTYYLNLFVWNDLENLEALTTKYVIDLK